MARHFTGSSIQLQENRLRGPLIFGRADIRFRMRKRVKPARRVTKRVTRRPAARKRALKASTRDVLDNSAPAPKPPRKWARHHRRLLELREHLLRERGMLTTAAREEVPQFSSHMGDAGTDMYDRDFALGMLSSEQDALYEIGQAMDRIRDGTYGVCEVTSKRIAPERLEAIPWTRFSAEAERQLEREGAVTRARLGPREKVPRHETAHEVGEEQS
jgi:RNA polymerase-binding transcription factor DksA